MRLYYSTDVDRLDAGAYLRFLPPARAEKVLRLRREGDRQASVFAYLLLACAVMELCGQAPGDFRYGQYGKPYLADLPSVFFSLSHTRGGVACCVGKAENGVDIQAIGSFSDAVAHRVLSPAELRQLEAADDKRLAFTRLWTRKEAYLKLHGTGLSQNLRQIDTTALSEIYTLELPSHVLSVCGEKLNGVYQKTAADMVDEWNR